MAVDDHLMKITHVLRGDEWLPSTPKHVLLYRMFGWEAPEFYHLSVILGADRKKLSKRNGDTHVSQFLENGYLKEALLNYIALIGWNSKTTKEIFLTLRHGKESNHSVPTCGAVDYETKPQTIDPYLLGIWLGDGSSDTGAITTADPEVLKGVEHSLIPCSTNKKSKALLYRCLGLTTQLRELGLLRNKHIPRAYLQGDRGQRLSLLQGLMDSDGHCSFTGNVEFCNMNETLAHQVKELMLSLGMKANLSKGEAKLRGVSHGTKFRVGCVTSLPVFRLARKLERITSNSGKVQNSKRSTRYIVDVQPIPPPQ
jgi:intein/homing endonuclease